MQDQLSFLIEKAHTTGFKYDLALTFRDSEQPITNPLEADTLQLFDVTQTASQIFTEGGFIKKIGTGQSWGTNFLKQQGSINKSAGYVFSFTLIPQGGSLRFGLNDLFMFQLDTTKIHTVSKYSVMDINYLYQQNKVYQLYIIVRNNGAFWLIKDGTEYYLVNPDSFNVSATMKAFIDFSNGASSLGHIRSKQCSFSDYYFDSMSITNPQQGATFTHNQEGWLVFKIGSGVNGSVIFRKQDANNYYKLSIASNLGTLSEIVDGVETVLNANMSGFSNTTEVKIFLNGSNLRIFNSETSNLKVNITNSKFTSAVNGEIPTLTGSLGYIKSMPLNVTAFDLTELEEISFISEPLPTDFVEETIYASPSGTGDGTQQNPYSLQTALTKLGPGKTLALLSGTYSNQSMVINISGTETYPIIIKPIGWVKIDSLDDFNINGSYIKTDSSEGVIEVYTDSWTGDRFVTSQTFDFSIGGSYVDLDSWIIHDFGNVGVWSNAVNSNLKGCLIYNIGRGNGSQGHSMYTQNVTGIHRFDSCVFIVNFDSAFCLHQYGSGSSDLSGYRYNKCIMVNGRNLMGGGVKVEDSIFENGIVINGNCELSTGFKSANVEWKNNKLFDSNLNIKKSDYLIFKNNYIAIETVGNGNMVNVADGDIVNNDYVFYNWLYPEYPNRFNVNYVYGNLQTIKDQTGFEEGSTETVLSTASGLKPDDDLIVDVFDPEKAIVTVANYSEQSAVNVLLTGLDYGTYYAYNAQNPDERFQFTWSGSAVSFAMTGWTKSVPIATAGGQMNQNAKKLLFPRFGVFYISKFQR